MFILKMEKSVVKVLVDFRKHRENNLKCGEQVLTLWLCSVGLTLQQSSLKVGRELLGIHHNQVCPSTQQ